MLSGYPPFQSKTQEEIYEKVRNLSYVWPKDSERGNNIPDEAKSLVGSCLNLAENERPEPDDFVEHPFFNMYDGCIPRQLDPACRHTKPIWLKSEEPRGDSMILGYSLDYDENLLEYAAHIDDPRRRYRACKDAFYTLCGVGRKHDSSIRKSAGKSWSKSAFAECCVEDESGLQPVMPLPKDSIYKYPHTPEGDWSVPEPASTVYKDESIVEQKRSVSLRNNAASLSRTQAALAAVHQRRRESQSHAATLRQQAVNGRGSVRKFAAIGDPPVPTGRPFVDLKEPPPDVNPPSTAPTRGLAERPIRTRRGAAASYSGSTRDVDENVVSRVAKSSSVPNMLTVGKTRSQSKKLEAAGQDQSETATASNERVPSDSDRLDKARDASARSVSKAESKDSTEKEDEGVRLKEATASGTKHSHGESEAHHHQDIRRTNAKSASSGSKPGSSLGVSPLLHSEDPCELLPETSPEHVNANLRLMLSNLVPHSSTRRRAGCRGSPHAYVIKWVDYTNRYGIGYVLDDGSVGCVFRGENGQPASCVVVRNGEKHFRRKARAMESRGKGDYYDYSEAEQLVPQRGKPVEFYENCETESFQKGGVRRALISPSEFEVKGSHAVASGAGIRVRTNSGIDCARSDAEKIKRVKLVDQFGKYMIRSLGRHGDDGAHDDQGPGANAGQYIKFYQRLGNVGVWGFGDGAFQVCLFRVETD